jgi:hypothetical protein
VKTELPLDRMSTLDKLRVLEEIWNDLLAKSEEVPVPDWHINVLAAREKRIADGTAVFKEWNEAKDSIRHRIR